jgi:hypothetical protein
VSALALGALLGFVTQRSIGLGAAANEAFATSTGPWAIVAALIGRCMPDIKSAVVTSTVCLWSATVVFYAAGGPPGAGGTPGFWLAAIVVVGPILGWLGRASAAHGAVGSLAAGVIAGWLIGEALHTALADASGPWHGPVWFDAAGHWHRLFGNGAAGPWHPAAGSGDSSRWLSVAVDGIAAACWVLAARGPRRVVAATLLPMTAAPAVCLAAAEALIGATIR